MPIEVRCPNAACGRGYSLSDDLAGRKVKCKQCGQTFVAGDSSSASRVDRPTVVPNASGESTIAPNTPQEPNTPPEPTKQPPRLGRFELRKKLGSGGFGVVYRAFDPQLEREVALKVPRPGTLDNPKALERFLREAKAAARLRHPNIVPVFDAGRDGDQYFIAAAFIAGTSLDDVVAEGPVDPNRAAGITAKLAAALDYAHNEGIIHRDVKPANVMLDDQDRPHLMDFGLARLEATSEKLTRDGAVLGTPAYMSPEQADGKTETIGSASDQYSLGVQMYELLTGEVPFSGPPQVVIVNILTQPPRPPRQIRPGIPKDLETICLKAMAKEPNKRYATCADFAADIERWQTGEPITARRVGSAERLVRWAKRNPVIAGLTVAAAALIATIAIGATGAAIRLTQLANARQKEADRANSFSKLLREEKDAAEREKNNAKALAERNAGLAASEAAARTKADASAKETSRQLNNTRRQFYTAQMNLAQSDWENFRLHDLAGRLTATMPEKLGGEDLRGHEWFLWDRMTRPYTVTFTPPKDELLDESWARPLAYSRSRHILLCGPYLKETGVAAHNSTHVSLVGFDVTHGRPVFVIVLPRDSRSVLDHDRSSFVFMEDDGQILAAHGDGSVFGISLPTYASTPERVTHLTPKQIELPKGKTPTEVLGTSPDGRWIAATSEASLFLLSRKDMGFGVAATFEAAQTGVFSSDGSVFAFLNTLFDENRKMRESQTITIVDMLHQRRASSIDLVQKDGLNGIDNGGRWGDNLKFVAISDDKTTLYATSNLERSVMAISATTGKRIWSRRLNVNIDGDDSLSLLHSPRSRVQYDAASNLILVRGTTDGRYAGVSVFNAAAGELIKEHGTTVSHGLLALPGGREYAYSDGHGVRLSSTFLPNAVVTSTAPRVNARITAASGNSYSLRALPADPQSRPYSAMHSSADDKWTTSLSVSPYDNLNGDYAEQVLSVALSPNGRFCVAGCLSGTVIRGECHSRVAKWSEFARMGAGITSVDINDRGECVVFTSEGSIRVFSSTGGVLAERAFPPPAGSSLASADNRSAVANSPFRAQFNYNGDFIWVSGLPGAHLSFLFRASPLEPAERAAVASVTGIASTTKDSSSVAAWQPCGSVVHHVIRSPGVRSFQGNGIEHLTKAIAGGEFRNTRTSSQIFLSQNSSRAVVASNETVGLLFDAISGATLLRVSQYALSDGRISLARNGLKPLGAESLFVESATGGRNGHEIVFLVRSGDYARSARLRLNCAPLTNDERVVLEADGAILWARAFGAKSRDEVVAKLDGDPTLRRNVRDLAVSRIEGVLKDAEEWGY